MEKPRYVFDHYYLVGSVPWGKRIELAPGVSARVIEESKNPIAVTFQIGSKYIKITSADNVQHRFDLGRFSYTIMSKICGVSQNETYLYYQIIKVDNGYVRQKFYHEKRLD